ncbi:MAG: DHH family phosphoesterase [Eubacteriales bacterium]
MSSNKNYDLSTFDLMLMSAGTGFILLAVALLTAALTEIPLGVIALVFIAVYVIFEAILCLYGASVHKRENARRTSDSLEHLISEAVRKIELPTVITSADGKIFWVNTKLVEISDKTKASDFWGKNFSELSDVPMSEIITATSRKVISAYGTNYYARSYLMEATDRDYWLTTLEDRTEVDLLEKRVNSESPVVAYISVDNREELLRYVQGSYRESAAAIEQILIEWAASLGGLLREYDRDKYIMIFPKDKLPGCTDANFDILDRIREIHFGDGSMSVTVSMGISDVGKNIGEKSKNAQAALDTALQRGGDQVALRTSGGTEYYGGKTKLSSKRTKIRPRVVAEKLVEHVTAAGNVLIMGHKNPDFDSIGSCVGLAKLALAHNPNVKIVIDFNNSNFEKSTKQLLASQPEYKDIFIDEARGLDMIRSDTLLVMADVNNMNIVEAPEIAANIKSIVIIDHHRKLADYENEPLISYIEPSASSASELVCELIEILSLGNRDIEPAKLSRHEANIMLAGIMLDTKNFTRTTSERTFSAAVYLRGVGADPEFARTFFYADLESFVTEAKLGSEVRLYRERIALTVCEGSGTPDDRIAASKTADTLLTVEGIDAAFVLIRTDEEIAISARSNGTINVQLILEKIGGGGHFDAAGAQVKNTVSREVLEQLKHAIDEYLDSTK